MFVWLWLVRLAALQCCAVFSDFYCKCTSHTLHCPSVSAWRNCRFFLSCFQLTKQCHPVFKLSTKDKTVGPSRCCGLFGVWRIGLSYILVCLHHVLCKTSFSACTGEGGDSHVLSRNDISVTLIFKGQKLYLLQLSYYILQNEFLCQNYKLISHNLFLILYHKCNFIFCDCDFIS